MLRQVHTGATQAAAPEMETRMETLQPRRRPGSPLESPDVSSADSREWSSMQGTNGHLASAGNSERNESYSYGQLAHQEASTLVMISAQTVNNQIVLVEKSGHIRTKVIAVKVFS